MQRVSACGFNPSSGGGREFIYTRTSGRDVIVTTFEQVCQVIMKFKGDKLSPEMLKPEASLTEDLMLDSLDLTELLVLSEDAFNLTIPLEDSNKLKTLGDAATYIDMRLSAK
jgi:acyl carrier protein